MELKGGPPSHDAFSELSGALDPEQLAVAMTKFANAQPAALPSDKMAVDGKVLRGTIMDASKQSALHLVQAFEPKANLVPGQMRIDGKSNETAEIPGLLEILDLFGRTAAAADAIHTRREASARVLEKGGDYVLPVKRNQKSLHEDVQVWFADPEARKETLSCRYVGGSEGRVEAPIATVSYDVGWLRDRHDWPGLKAAGRIKAVRERKGKEERSVRNHWMIENGFHWVPDAFMDEDRMRNRTLNGPECLSTLRRIGLNIVRLMDDKHSLKGWMEIVAMNDKYMLGMLVSAVGKF